MDDEEVSRVLRASGATGRTLQDIATARDRHVNLSTTALATQLEAELNIMRDEANSTFSTNQAYLIKRRDLDETLKHQIGEVKKLHERLAALKNSEKDKDYMANITTIIECISGSMDKENEYATGLMEKAQRIYSIRRRGDGNIDADIAKVVNEFKEVSDTLSAQHTHTTDMMGLLNSLDIGSLDTGYELRYSIIIENHELEYKHRVKSITEHFDFVFSDTSPSVEEEPEEKEDGVQKQREFPKRFVTAEFHATIQARINTLEGKVETARNKSTKTYLLNLIRYLKYVQFYGSWGISQKYVWEDDDGSKHNIGQWILDRHADLKKHLDDDNTYTINSDKMGYFSIAGFFARDSTEWGDKFLSNVQSSRLLSGEQSIDIYNIPGSYWICLNLFCLLPNNNLRHQCRNCGKTKYGKGGKSGAIIKFPNASAQDVAKRGILARDASVCLLLARSYDGAYIRHLRKTFLQYLQERVNSMSPEMEPNVDWTDQDETKAIADNYADSLDRSYIPMPEPTKAALPLSVPTLNDYPFLAMSPADMFTRFQTDPTSLTLENWHCYIASAERITNNNFILPCFCDIDCGKYVWCNNGGDFGLLHIDCVLRRLSIETNELGIRTFVDIFDNDNRKRASLPYFHPSCGGKPEPIEYSMASFLYNTELGRILGNCLKMSKERRAEYDARLRDLMNCDPEAMNKYNEERRNAYRMKSEERMRQLLEESYNHEDEDGVLDPTNPEHIKAWEQEVEEFVEEAGPDSRSYCFDSTDPKGDEWRMWMSESNRNNLYLEAKGNRKGMHFLKEHFGRYIDKDDDSLFKVSIMRKKVWGGLAATYFEKLGMKKLWKVHEGKCANQGLYGPNTDSHHGTIEERYHWVGVVVIHNMGERIREGVVAYNENMQDSYFNWIQNHLDKEELVFVSPSEEKLRMIGRKRLGDESLVDARMLDEERGV